MKTNIKNPDRKDIADVHGDLNRALFKAGFKQVNFHEDESIKAYGRGFEVTMTLKKMRK